MVFKYRCEETHCSGFLCKWIFSFLWWASSRVSRSQDTYNGFLCSFSTSFRYFTTRDLFIVHEIGLYIISRYSYYEVKKHYIQLQVQVGGMFSLDHLWHIQIELMNYLSFRIWTCGKMVSYSIQIKRVKILKHPKFVQSMQKIK